MCGKKKSKSGLLTTAGIGSGLALGVNGFVLAALTGLLLKGKIGEGISEKVVFAVHVVAMVIGSEIAKRIYGASNIRVIGMVGGIYGVVLVICGMLIDGSFRNIPIHIIAICGGVLTSCALCIFKPGRNGKRKKAVW